MKTILALAALLVFQTAHSEETFDIIHASADAWVYQPTPDVWALPAEIQLKFNVCLKNHDSGAPLNKFKFVIFNADTIERATNEVYESNGTGCFQWYEKFPVAPFPASISPVKVRRTIRPTDSFKGFAAIAEYTVLPDPMHPTVTSLLAQPEIPGTISEAAYRSSLNVLAPAGVSAKHISLRLQSVNWKAYQVELVVDIEPEVKVMDWNGLPSYRAINAGAFTVAPVIITANTPAQDFGKPETEGSSSISFIERRHMQSPFIVHINSEVFPNTAHFLLGLRLTPTNFEGKAPVRESDVICDMGWGLAALGTGSSLRDCEILPACQIDGSPDCNLDKYFPPKK